MPDTDAIHFATLMVDLLDRSSTTSTYKYAVLLGLVDCCQAQVRNDGTVPSIVTTRQLAQRVLEIYWGHARPFSLTGNMPQQNSGGQAKVLSKIQAFRQNHRQTSAFSAERANPTDFAQLLNDIEWILIQMPLPRVQVIGASTMPFLYDISWTASVRKGADGVAAYQRRFLKAATQPSHFDNRIMMKPGAAENLVRLAPLLRPLIQREWSQTVAGFNGLQTSALDGFLFDPDRQALTRLVEPLRSAQEGNCFYCQTKLSAACEVDHFIPWSRSPNDGLHNFVLAHKRCNGSKSNHLADVIHLEKWRKRNNPDHRLGRRFDAECCGLEWLRNRDETLSIARSLYLSVPASMPLWRIRNEFSPADIVAIETALN